MCYNNNSKNKKFQAFLQVSNKKPLKNNILWYNYIVLPIKEKKMEAYTEQVVKIKQTALSVILRILLWFVDITSTIMMLILTLPLYPVLYGLISMVLLVFIFLVNYFAIIFNRKFNVEFEYIRTDWYLDVDKVCSGRTRERVSAVNLREVEKVGKYSFEEEYGEKKRFICANADDDLFYIIYTDKKHGKSLLVIAPNQKLLEGLKFHLPRQVWIDAFGRN